MDRATLTTWIERYERLWRTPRTDGLAELFSADLEYRPSPWRDPIRGLEALGRFWDAAREGADEPFTMTADVVATLASKPLAEAAL